MRFGFAGRLWAAASLLFVASCSTGLLPLLSSAPSAFSSALADEVGSNAVDPATGFVPLFNGRDFTGWRFSDASALPKTPPAAWRIESGAIVGTGGGTGGCGCTECCTHLPLPLTGPYCESLIDIENLVLSDTFHTWFDRTNQVIDKLNPLNLYEI